MEKGQSVFVFYVGPWVGKSGRIYLAMHNQGATHLTNVGVIKSCVDLVKNEERSWLVAEKINYWSEAP